MAVGRGWPSRPVKVGHVLPAADGSIEPVGETEQDQVRVGSRRGLPETMPVCV